MFIISHLSLPTQLGQKKMFTQLESQFGMILTFDWDHVSTVPGSRITKVFRKLFFQFSQAFKSILLSIILKIDQLRWWALQVWQINTCFLKSRLRQEAVLPGLCKKERRGRSSGGHCGSHHCQKSTIAAVETIIFSAFLYSILSCIKMVHVKYRGPILRVTMIWNLTNQGRVFKFCEEPNAGHVTLFFIKLQLYC